jgi:hypothetical protein
MTQATGLKGPGESSPRLEEPGCRVVDVAGALKGRGSAGGRFPALFQSAGRAVGGSQGFRGCATATLGWILGGFQPPLLVVTRGPLALDSRWKSSGRQIL